MKPLFVLAGVLLFAAPALATAPPVPEPGTLSLLGAAAVGAVLFHRIRRGR